MIITWFKFGLNIYIYLLIGLLLYFKVTNILCIEYLNIKHINKILRIIIIFKKKIKIKKKKIIIIIIKYKLLVLLTRFKNYFHDIFLMF